MALTRANSIQHPLQLLGATSVCCICRKLSPTHTAHLFGNSSSEQIPALVQKVRVRWLLDARARAIPCTAARINHYFIQVEHSDVVLACDLPKQKEQHCAESITISSEFCEQSNDCTSRTLRPQPMRNSPWLALLHAHLRSGQVVRGNARVQDAFWHSRCRGVGSIGWDGRCGRENNCVGGCYKAPADVSHEGCVIR